MKKFYILLFTACMITLSGRAQTWTSYTTSNGLADNNVRCIAIDNQDVKWFGTQSGVSKFDGSTWTTYNYSTGNLPSNFTYAIKVDAQNNKWFGTVAGITKFNGATWTTYNTTNGLANNVVYAIDEDAQGNIWIGTSGGGVSKFNGTTFTNYTTANGLAANYVNSLSIDNLGIIWIGTNQGVSKFDGTTFTNYNTTNGLVNNTVYAIAFDAQGNTWFGTQAGVSIFNGTSFTNYTTSNGLPHNLVRAVTIDDQDNKWIGTGAGVAKYTGSSFTTYTTSNGLVNNIVNAITFDGLGNRWHGTNGGISKYAVPVTIIDAGVTAITSPSSGINLTNSEQVTVNIKNFGNTAISSGLTVKYKLDNGTVISETHNGSIAVGATVSHTFSSSINLFAEDTYSLKAYTTLSGDINTVNDTTTKDIVNTQVGIEEIAESDGINIYPNPAKRTLSVDHVKKNTSIKIYNHLGKLIMETTAHEDKQTIDISSFENGIYLIQLIDSLTITTKQFIKH